MSDDNDKEQGAENQQSAGSAESKRGPAPDVPPVETKPDTTATMHFLVNHDLPNLGGGDDDANDGDSDVVQLNEDK